jgi:hypothetical protein
MVRQVKGKPKSQQWSLCRIAIALVCKVIEFWTIETKIGEGAKLRELPVERRISEESIEHKS